MTNSIDFSYNDFMERGITYDCNSYQPIDNSADGNCLFYSCFQSNLFDDFPAHTSVDNAAECQRFRNCLGDFVLENINDTTSSYYLILQVYFRNILLERNEAHINGIVNNIKRNRSYQGRHVLFLIFVKYGININWLSLCNEGIYLQQSGIDMFQSRHRKILKIKNKILRSDEEKPPLFDLAQEYNEIIPLMYHNIHVCFS